MRPLNPKSNEEILAIAIPLFAKSGYSGVSMRNIAEKVGVSPAALYHHFSGKETLYLAAMTQTFVDKAAILKEILGSRAAPEERLAQFVARFCELLDQDNDFSMLIQREIMDGDKSRLQFLATEVFHGLFQGVIELCRELDSLKDPYLTAVSLIGVVMYHFQVAVLKPYLPYSREHYNDPQVVAQHATKFILQGLKTC
ncbi:MAG: TetR/AcrR family transcriptional regulator [Pseudomonadota bacterium]|nr:TetR/AcrR family transcriptional regulator [Pseudomonadota bacterium]